MQFAAKIMKHSAIFVILLCSLTLLSGCDFVRKAAGRPTSADLEQMRTLKAQKEAREQFVLDSLACDKARLEREKADSLAATDSFAVSGILFRSTGDFGGIVSKGGDFTYGVAVGSFKKASNADRLSERLSEAGISSTIAVTATGLNTVLACPCSKIAELWREYSIFKESPLYPRDAWILVKARQNEN